MSLGDFLKHIRMRHGMTQAEFGDICFRNKDMVSRWENDKEKPTLKELTQLAMQLSEPVLLLVTYGVALNDVLETKKQA